LPIRFLNFPAAHGEQMPPSGPVYPRSQTQSPNRVLYGKDREFCGQTLHWVPVPVEVEKVPAGQAAHCPVARTPTTLKKLTQWCPPSVVGYCTSGNCATIKALPSGTNAMRVMSLNSAVVGEPSLTPPNLPPEGPDPTKVPTCPDAIFKLRIRLL
jgi:hypothetical protein